MIFYNGGVNCMKEIGNYAILDGGAVLFELSASMKGLTEDVNKSTTGITVTPVNRKGKEVDFSHDGERLRRRYGRIARRSQIRQ